MAKETESLSERFIKLRESAGMSRPEFAEYLNIPYRTMQEWELGRRSMPEYVFALIEFKVQTEFGLTSKELKDPNALGNPMRGLEDQIEQNDNQLDGIINNLPEETVAEKEAKSSVVEKLKAIIIDPHDRDERKHSPCPGLELE